MRVIFLLSFVALSSCSTAGRSRVYGAIAGSLIAGYLGMELGRELSPNKDSERGNKIMGLATGTITGGMTGYYLGNMFYEDDPQNHEDPPLKFDRSLEPPQQEELKSGSEIINLSDLAISRSSLKAVYEASVIKGVPKELEESVSKQRILRHVINPHVFKTNDGRTFYFKGGEAIEHQYVQ